MVRASLAASVNKYVVGEKGTVFGSDESFFVSFSENLTAFVANDFGDSSTLVR
jgi:hypothetical protein